MMNNIKFKSISKDNYEILENLALELNTEDMNEVMNYLICHWIDTDELAQDMGYFSLPIDTIDIDTPKENDKPKEKYNGKLPF